MGRNQCSVIFFPTNCMAFCIHAQTTRLNATDQGVSTPIYYGAQWLIQRKMKAVEKIFREIIS